MKFKLLFFLTFSLISFLFIYKLDYPYFFTDEVLYTTVGHEYVMGKFENNLQHPLIGKYIVGLVTLFSKNNVFFLRLPYAIMGILSALIVYLIVNKYYGEKFGMVGALLYVSFPFVYETTRMVMFESPMHLFWLLFHFFFLSFLDKEEKKFLVPTGIFLGLSIATKIPSILLYPFVLIIYIFYLVYKRKKLSIKKVFSTIFPIYAISVATYGITYVPIPLSSNIVNVAKETLKVFLGRNSEGKEHVINGMVYTKSPWWTYGYFISKSYTIPQAVLVYISPIIAFFKSYFFVFYWLVFLIMNIVFFQFIPLKNARYIASMEISLVFLVVAFLHYVYINVDIPVVRVATTIVVFYVLISRLLFVLNQQKTEYNWVYSYFKDETHSFQDYKRIYVFGSIRSMQWYRGFVPDMAMWIYRRDYNIMCIEFPYFNYIAFDQDELLKSPDNTLFRYVQENTLGFEKIEIPNFTIYKKINSFKPIFDCSRL